MKGLDLLGLGHRLWPVAETIEAVPAGLAIGCFAVTFGDALVKLRAMLATGKYPAARIHLWWWTDKPGMPFHCIAPIKVIQNLAPKYEKLALEFPSVKIYLSHSCEHYETNKAAIKKRLELLWNLAPSCIPVNCIAGKGAVMPGLNENHPHSGKSSLKPPYIVSNDGADVSEIGVPAYLKAHKDAKICFLWASRFNLRTPGDKNPPPPKRRKNPPDAKFIKSIVRLLN